MDRAPPAIRNRHLCHWPSRPSSRAAPELMQAHELVHCCLQGRLEIWRDRLLLRKLLEDLRLAGLHVFEPKAFEAEDLLLRDLVEVATGAGPQRHDNLRGVHRHELLLLQELCENATAKELVLCGRIQVG